MSRRFHMGLGGLGFVFSDQLACPVSTGDGLINDCDTYNANNPNALYDEANVPVIFGKQDYYIDKPHNVDAQGNDLGEIDDPDWMAPPDWVKALHAPIPYIDITPGVFSNSDYYDAGGGYNGVPADYVPYGSLADYPDPDYFDYSYDVNYQALLQQQAQGGDYIAPVDITPGVNFDAPYNGDIAPVDITPEVDWDAAYAQAASNAWLNDTGDIAPVDITPGVNFDAPTVTNATPAQGTSWNWWFGGSSPGAGAIAPVDITPEVSWDAAYAQAASDAWLNDSGDIAPVDITPEVDWNAPPASFDTSNAWPGVYDSGGGIETVTVTGALAPPVDVQGQIDAANAGLSTSANAGGGAAVAHATDLSAPAAPASIAPDPPIEVVTVTGALAPPVDVQEQIDAIRAGLSITANFDGGGGDDSGIETITVTGVKAPPPDLMPITMPDIATLLASTVPTYLPGFDDDIETITVTGVKAPPQDLLPIVPPDIPTMLAAEVPTYLPGFDDDDIETITVTGVKTPPHDNLLPIEPLDIDAILQSEIPDQVNVGGGDDGSDQAPPSVPHSGGGFTPDRPTVFPTVQPPPAQLQQPPAQDPRVIVQNIYQPPAAPSVTHTTTTYLPVPVPYQIPPAGGGGTQTPVATAGADNWLLLATVGIFALFAMNQKDAKMRRPRGN